MTEIDALDARLRAHGVHAAIDGTPWLGAAIDADAAARRFDGWARSTIVDEHVGGPVLPRGVFEALHERAGLPARWPVGNAGLLHVYGYLLSTVPTPFGLKRDRWLHGTLATACGLDTDAFVPWATTTSPLQRVTAAADALLDTAPPIREALDAEGDPAAQRFGLTAIVETEAAAALAYAIEQGGHRLLVTMFPIADAAGIRAELAAGPPRPRWNASLAH